MSQLDKFKRFTITSALPYANGPLHIGHLAGAYLPADIFVRYLRLKKKDVVYVCGSDEHGAAITIKAKKKALLRRLLLINTITKLSRVSKISVSTLIFTTALHRLYIMTCRRSFS